MQSKEDVVCGAAELFCSNMTGVSVILSTLLISKMAGKITKMSWFSFQDMENKIRSTLNEIYFGKTKDIVNGLR